MGILNRVFIKYGLPCIVENSSYNSLFLLFHWEIFDNKVFIFMIFFILFYKIRHTKQILNLLKYLRVHWLGLTTEINSNNGVPTKKTHYYTCTKTLIGFRQTINNMI